MSVDGGIANNNNKQRGRPKRRRSKEGTVGTREAPRIWSEEEDKLLLNAVEKYGQKIGNLLQQKYQIVIMYNICNDKSIKTRFKTRWMDTTRR